nr:uncharacterized protein LOC109415052 [Aedes albopictus]
MASTSMAFGLEPFRKGTSFNDWFTRLKYFFSVNNIKEENKLAYFITMSGPIIFSEIKLLYPAGDFEKATLDDIVSKLKNRLDKTDPDLVQRYKFSTRVQNPDEPTEDFVLSLKLQAEFCGFANFKEVAILDRIIAGLRDKNLRQKLLSEEKLSLNNAEKIIATWEVARANAGTAEPHNNDVPNLMAYVEGGPRDQQGIAMRRLANVYENARTYQEVEATGNRRGPVKSRLGVRPSIRGGRVNYEPRAGSSRQDSQGLGRQWQRPDYSQMICNYCGVKGHIKKKCFKLKNLNRDTVNLVESYKPGPSANRHITELLERMRTNDSDDEDYQSDSDMHWKRQPNSTSNAN